MAHLEYSHLDVENTLPRHSEPHCLWCREVEAGQRRAVCGVWCEAVGGVCCEAVGGVWPVEGVCCTAVWGVCCEAAGCRRRSSLGGLVETGELVASEVQ